MSDCKEYYIKFDQRGMILYSDYSIIPEGVHHIENYLPIFGDIESLQNLSIDELSPYECLIDENKYFFHLKWGLIHSNSTNQYEVRIIDKTEDYLRTQKERSLKNKYRINHEKLKTEFNSEVNAKNQLQKKNHELETIFKHSLEGIAYQDAKTMDLISINQRGLDILGCKSIDELNNQMLMDFYIHDNLTHPRSKTAFFIYIKKLLIREGEINEIVKIKRLNGEFKWITLRVIEDSNHNDRPINVIFISDISKEHQALQAIEIKNEELMRYIESNIQLEQFAHVASHDLRAPIITIRSFSKLLKNKMSSQMDLNQEKYLDLIINNSDQMFELVNDLLEYAKINSQSIQLNHTGIGDLVESVCNVLNIQALENQVSIDIPYDLPTIVADEIKIKRVFQNLISNSIKFSDNHKKSVVKINWEENDDQWIFHVTDNGIGISHTTVDIFQPYKQLNTKSEYQGTGMGLAICQKIINQHKGEISYISEIGIGSKFSFSISKDLTEGANNYMKLNTGKVEQAIAK
jgi:PAS domain S-box-containing protein